MVFTVGVSVVSLKWCQEWWTDGVAIRKVQENPVGYGKRTKKL